MTLTRSQRAERAAGRREHRKRATRSDLIRAGRALFSEKGLYESRIEELTRHAGIAKGTLYTYFADKDELIRAVVQTGLEELAGLVSTRTRGTRSLEAVVRLAVRAHLDFFEANPDLMRVLHQARGMLKFDRREWRPLRQTLAAYLEALAGALSNADVVARLPARRRRELAGLLFGAVSGVTSVRAATRSDASPVGGRGRFAAALETMTYAYVRGAAAPARTAPRSRPLVRQSSLTMRRRSRPPAHRRRSQ